jgi:hypothetical protein
MLLGGSPRALSPVHALSLPSNAPIKVKPMQLADSAVAIMTPAADMRRVPKRQAGLPEVLVESR